MLPDVLGISKTFHLQSKMWCNKKQKWLRKFNMEVHFGTLVYVMHFYSGISIVGIKNKLRTSFKSLVSMTTRTWQLQHQGNDKV